MVEKGEVTYRKNKNVSRGLEEKVDDEIDESSKNLGNMC